MADPDTIDVWTDTYRVRAYEADATGHASPITLCNYLQETAGRHAQDLGFSYGDMGNHSWVLARLRIAIDTLPAWGDDVALATWPAGFQGLFGYRAFELNDTAGRVLVRAQSAWVVFDVQRRRPARLPVRVQSLRLPDRPLPLSLPDDKLTPPADLEDGISVPVTYSDLDVNQHTNNAAYLRWTLDALPPALHNTHRLAALEMDFRAETTIGDTIRVAHRMTDAPTPEGWHRLVRTSDNRDVAVLRTRWAPRPTTSRAFAPHPAADSG